MAETTIKLKIKVIKLPNVIKKIQKLKLLLIIKIFKVETIKVHIKTIMP